MKSESQPVQTVAAMDLQRWTAAEELPFFERKSTWDRSGQHPEPRRTKDIAYDIAETLERDGQRQWRRIECVVGRSMAP